MTTISDDAGGKPIPLSQPPWKLKGTIYTFMTYTTAKDAAEIAGDKPFLYSALERDSSFAEGKYLGGIGMVQVIRYSESPVGPYDEMLLVPGFFEYDVESVDKNGMTKIQKKNNAKITRIYVSQKETCFNGRTNWNIPKHIAHFTFNTLEDKSLSIAVHPLDDESGEISNKSSPFFSAIFKPISYLPSIPASTVISKYVGVDLHIVQPPLPEGASATGELAGTDKWSKIMPYEYSRKTSFGWWDLKQTSDSPTEEDPLLSASGPPGRKEDGRPKYENWWPGSGRWRIGMVMEDAEIRFPEPERWTTSRL